MRYGVGVLGEVGLVEALSVAVAEQPGDLLLQHRPDHLRKLLALRNCEAGRENRLMEGKKKSNRMEALRKLLQLYLL